MHDLVDMTKKIGCRCDGVLCRLAVKFLVKSVANSMFCRHVYMQSHVSFSIAMQQEEYDILYNYIHGEKFSESLSKNKKDSLRRKSKSFVVKAAF